MVVQFCSGKDLPLGSVEVEYLNVFLKLSKFCWISFNNGHFHLFSEQSNRYTNEHIFQIQNLNDSPIVVVW